MKNVKIYLPALFFISSALLALEISLMRVLRIEGFGNFTTTAIALAMTGFGAGGTIVFLFKRRFSGKEHILSMYSAVLVIFFIGLGYYISKQVTFDPLRIVWDKNQLLRLLFRYFLYAIPFISGSVFIVLAFLIKRAGRVYFFNLSGSGFGIAVILAALYFIPSDRIFIVPLICAFLTALLLYIGLNPGFKHVIISLILICAGFYLFSQGRIHILPYKGIKLALNLPDARIVQRKLSPFGTLEVVKSSKIRKAPGLSLAYEGPVPKQLGLFLDGDSLSVIERRNGDETIDYLRYQTQAAVYELHQDPDVFIVGLGGGTSALRAYLHGARSLTIAEENPHLKQLIVKSMTTYNKNFFSQPNVSVVISSGREQLRKVKTSYDIIEISETDSSVSSIGGIYSSDINYASTTQAFREYLAHLQTHGTLSVTLLLRYPPRNLPKLINIAHHALRKSSSDPLKCMIVLRSWASGTVLIKTIPFTQKEIEKIKAFCKRMFFDLVYYPGIHEKETNQYNILEEAIYYKITLKILQDDRSFIKNYPFNIRHTTDDRPYFSHFFKIRKLSFLFREMGRKWIFVVEGGYLVLFSTFVLIIILSFILIIIPHFFTGARLGKESIRIISYFSLIAVAYMFIEIVLIKKFLRLLENPIYSSSVIISALLIFSSAGSLIFDLRLWRKPRIAVYAMLFLTIYAPLIFIILDILYLYLRTAPLVIKLTISTALLAPLGTIMGIPFPAAIDRLRKRREGAVPWAWSINSYFSVIASTGAVLLSSNIGLLSTCAVAALCYFGAALLYKE